jgi:XTP/dITP diphosphohydrolase
LDLIVLATRNEGKAAELKWLLHGVAARVESLRDHPDVTLPPETGATYRENAIAKARAVYDALRVPALGDDSGLEVDALDGAPGLYSARYAGPNATDLANNEKLLRALEGRSAGERTARFRCVLAFLTESVAPMVFEGSCEGRIIEAPRGRDGFGYDPVFLPDGETVSFAELKPERKNLFSHRARATQELIFALG